MIQRDVVSNLDVVTCGTILHQPARLFASKIMTNFLDKMKSVYDLVLIDAPPVLVVNDAAVIAAEVDAVILIVSAGETRTATLERAAEFLDSAGGHLLGVVLNKFDAKKAYGGYYGGFRFGHYGPTHEYYSTTADRAGPKVDS